MKWWHYGLLISLVMATIISVYASSHPDGLERVAEDLGFLGYGKGHEIISAPMPDYVIPGIKNKTIAASLAGFAGTLIVFVVVYLMGASLKKK